MHQKLLGFMIYNILIVGGGSKLGLELTKNYLIKGHNVDVITGSDLSEYQKEYKNLKVVEVTGKLQNMLLILLKIK